MREGWQREEPPIDLGRDEIREIVASAVGASDVLGVEQVEGGLRSTIYRLALADEPEPTCLRLYPSLLALELERAVLAVVPAAVPTPRWRAWGTHAARGLAFALLEWVPGVTLHAAAQGAPPAELERLARCAGRALGQIHAVRFERTGFFTAPTLEVREPLDATSAGLLAFAEQCLFRQHGSALLGEDFARATFEWLSVAASRLDAGGSEACLVHGDYGATNLLVREGGAGLVVLDWEFACAGVPAFDLGNLLRDPLGKIPAFTRGLGAGYREVGGELEPDWEQRAALSDLFACFHFLSRAEANGERVPAIRRRIQQIRDDVGG